MSPKRKSRGADSGASVISPTADSTVSAQTTASTPNPAATPETPRSVRSRLRHSRPTPSEAQPRKLTFQDESPEISGPAGQPSHKLNDTSGGGPLTEALQLVPAAACSYSSNLRLAPMPADFSLAQSFCSYGYFFLAPNVWIPAPLEADEDFGVFYRPLSCPTVPHPRIHAPSADDHTRRVVHVIVQQDKAGNALIIHTRSETDLLTCHKDFIQAAVVRMLRTDLNLEAWYACHPEAAARGFGRTYRSPSVFEDMVKTITNCNVTFKNTTTMNAALCREFGADGVAFPEPSDLAAISPEDLKARGRVGYRAASIIALAQAFVAGELSEDWFHDATVPTAEVYQKILSLKGFGPYATSNVSRLFPDELFLS